MKKRKAIWLCSLALMMSAMAATPAFATASPLTDEEKARWERLKDQVLEYDELEDLIKEYNPAVQVNESSYNTDLAKKRELEQNLRDYADELDQDVEDMKEAGMTGDMLTGAIAYANTVKGAANSTKKDMKDMSSKTKTAAYTEMRDELSATAQTMMISYNQKRLQQEVLAKNLELANTSLTSTQAKKDLGMATEADVLAAQKQIKTIEGQKTELDQDMDQLRQSLCLMTGWGYNDHPDIRTIPGVDLAKIDAIDVTEDVRKAQGNNYTVRGYTNPGSAGNTLSQKEIHGRTYDLAVAEVATKVEAQYQTILSVKGEYLSQETLFQKAQLDMDSADRKYQLGMLSKEDYLQEQLKYLQQKADFETANMNLFQAVETYNWYVRGLLKLDMVQ